jgi:cytochrome c-type biogenesis protein CcmH/NrfF
VSRFDISEDIARQIIASIKDGRSLINDTALGRCGMCRCRIRVNEKPTTRLALLWTTPLILVELVCEECTTNLPNDSDCI